MNDADREQWIINDEGLYRWWRGERTSMRKFIRANRAELTAIISSMLDRDPKGHSPNGRA